MTKPTSNVVPINETVRTEDALALAFERTNARRFVFNATANTWLFWNGKVWAADHTGMVIDAIRQHCRDSGASDKFQKSASVKGVEFFCRAARVFARSNADFDKDPWLLGTPGGTVELQTGTVRTADPADLITRSTSIAPVKGEPKRWLKFLQEATNCDASMIRYLKQFAGYSLTGNTSAHAVFFIFGNGGTGKSTFVNTLLKIFGSYGRTSPMDAFAEQAFAAHPTEIAMLDGARLVVANETEQGRKWAAARIKALSGGDEITARYMRQDFFSFRPQCKLCFVGNFAPNFESVDDALRRRFNVLPFDVKPAVKDERLVEALEREAPHILAWAIEGCADWRQNGFILPEKVREASGAYFEAQDQFSAWLTECISRDDYKATTLRSVALSSWNAFRHRSGEKPESGKDLAQRLRQAAFQEGKARGNASRERAWLGMEVRHVSHT